MLDDGGNQMQVASSQEMRNVPERAGVVCCCTMFPTSGENGRSFLALIFLLVSFLMTLTDARAISINAGYHLPPSLRVHTPVDYLPRILLRPTTRGALSTTTTQSEIQQTTEHQREIPPTTVTPPSETDVAHIVTSTVGSTSSPPSQPTSTATQVHCESVVYGRRRIYAAGERICLPQQSKAKIEQMAVCMPIKEINAASGRKWKCSSGSQACWMPCMYTVNDRMTYTAPTPECSCDESIYHTQNPRNSDTEGSQSESTLHHRPPSSEDVENSAVDCSIMDADCRVFGKCVNDLRQECNLPGLYGEVPCKSRYSISVSGGLNASEVKEPILNASVEVDALPWKSKVGQRWATSINRCIIHDQLSSLILHFHRQVSTKEHRSNPAAMCGYAQWTSTKRIVHCHRAQPLPQAVCNLDVEDRELMLWSRVAALGHAGCSAVRADQKKLRCGQAARGGPNIWNVSRRVVVDVRSDWTSEDGVPTSEPCAKFVTGLAPCRKWRKVVTVIREHLNSFHYINYSHNVDMGPGSAIGVLLVNASDTSIEESSAKNGTIYKMKSELQLEIIASPVLVRYNPGFDWNGHLLSLQEAVLGNIKQIDKNPIRFRVSDTSKRVYRASAWISGENSASRGIISTQINGRSQSGFGVLAYQASSSKSAMSASTVLVDTILAVLLFLSATVVV